jgi:hypothetical protein
MPRWWKKVSRTDAQQPTKGYLVGYLRLTQNRGALDPDVWFKDVLFAGLSWTPSFFGRNPVEEAFADFQVYEGGAMLAVHQLKLTHDAKRPLNHKHPATWIHWESLQPHLQANSREGWYVVVERVPGPAPQLILRFLQQKPAWRPGT